MGVYALRGSFVTAPPAANSGGVESGPLGYAGEWEVRRDYAQIYGRGGQRAVLLVGPWRGREAGLPHPTGAHEGHGRETGGYLGIFRRSKRVESAKFGPAFLVFGERLPAGQAPYILGDGPVGPYLVENDVGPRPTELLDVSGPYRRAQHHDPDARAPASQLA
jgi:hypothetical protein